MAKENIHIVAIGGGGGASQVLRAARSFAARLTAVIAVTDTGRSTGLARAIGRIPAPGDLRATIAAFAGDPLLARLLEHRFDGAGVPQLEGMAFGNLLIAALARLTGDFGAAVEQAARMAGCEAEVLPVSTADAHICAELADGTRVEGELQVRGLGKPPIARLALCAPAAAYPPALEAIRSADLVAIGPGSLFTTVLACLAFDGVAEALRAARGTVVYVCNTTTQPGQTDGYRAADHVRRVVEALGVGTLDVALINRSAPDEAALAAYAAQGLHLLRPDDAELVEIAGLGVRVVARPLTEQAPGGRALWNKQDTIRHDVRALGEALAALARGGV
ncbi:MAG TPA: gluconeogenesis factor YvcK family protein [Roseiflexaceae bacterium]|nr:gluconeogenesis factor YvcK family protein [Roseiflexaceae bacterium]